MARSIHPVPRSIIDPPTHHTTLPRTDKSALLYSVVVVLGSALSSIAIPLKSTKLLGLSQVLLGVGKGTLCTAQKVCTVGIVDDGQVDPNRMVVVINAQRLITINTPNQPRTRTHRYS